MRCIAAALFQIGEGEMDETFMNSLLEGEIKRALQPAPAEGLILWETDCGIDWLPMPVAIRSAAHLDHVGRHHALMASICHALKDT